MRSAQDIVTDYKRRGYDSFRLRSLAALRPEPIRSQILAILDAEKAAGEATALLEDASQAPEMETASRIFDEMELAESIAEPAEASIKETFAPEVETTSLSSHIQASFDPQGELTSEDFEMIEEPEEPAFDLVDESEEEAAEEATADEEPGAPNVPTPSLFRLVTKDKAPDQETARSEDLGGKIIRLFDDEETAEPDSEEVMRIRLFERPEQEAEWHDCGSGLILFPQEMYEQHAAYAQAVRQADSPRKEEPLDAAEEEADVVTLEELLQRVEKEAPRPTVPIPAIVPGKVAQGTGKSAEDVMAATAWNDGEEEARPDPEWTERALASVVLPAEALSDLPSLLQVAELEKALSRIEGRLAMKQEKLRRLASLLSEKDELLTLQNRQIEETRDLVAERDARIVELKAASSKLHDLARESMGLRIEKEEIERERNILKTETLPALEEQQLSLLAMMEDEASDHAKTRARLRKTTRRAFAGYALATAASACLALGATLYSLRPSSFGDASPAGATQEFVLVPDTSSIQVDNLQKSVETLRSEKEMAQLAFREAEAQWKAREGALLRKVQDRERELAMRSQELARDLNSMKTDRDRALEQYAYLQNQPDRPAPDRVVAEIVNRPAPPARPRQETGPSRIMAQNPAEPSKPLPGASGVKYVVKKGDTLSEIVARHYGTTQRGALTRKVAESNKIQNPNKLRAGQKLVLASL
ncbi:MAG: LysM peptidoglycan-binding domain-containing protein [Planctomycetota bacterium]